MSTDILSNTASDNHGGGIYSISPMTVTNSTISYNTTPDDGGGIMVYGTALHVQDCTISYNEANGSNGGGGIMVSDSTAIITGTTVSNNSSTSDDGGGICTDYLESNDVITITSSIILDNYAEDDGGGLKLDRCTAFISDTLIAGNYAYYDGGGLHIDYGSDVIITHSTLSENEADEYGGGLFSEGSEILAIMHTDVISNTASSCDGGGIYVEDSDDFAVSDSLIQGNDAWKGGGIYSVRPLTVTNSTISYNMADSDGGGIAQFDEPLNVISCTISYNESDGSTGGGGIYIDGNTTIITGTTVSNNSSTYDDGGGICTYYHDEVITITNSIIIDNYAEDDGGGLKLDGCTAFISNTLIAGNYAYYDGGGLHTDYSSDVTITHSTLSENEADEYGGGLFSEESGTLAIMHTDIISNTAWADDGGGIYVEDSDDFTVSDSLIQGNDAWRGGGIYLYDDAVLDRVQVVDNWTTGIGAGICTDDVDVTIRNSSFISNTTEWGGGGLEIWDGHATIISTTLSGNVADDGAGWGTGAGMQVDGGAQADLYNVTISENSDNGYDDDGGAGIMVYDSYADGTQVNLTNCTIVDNDTASTSSTGTGGGGISISEGAVTMTNTLVAGNTSATGIPDIAGTVTSGGHNLVGSTDGSTGITNGVNGDQAGDNANPLDAVTGALGDYGGDTETVPLLPGSPAIDAGDNAACAASPMDNLDQRGISRPQGSDCDVGAFESRGFSMTRGAGNDQIAGVGMVFDIGLEAIVSSAYGEPVNGGLVNYAGPTAGAGITPTTGTASIINGSASYTPTANSTVGAYNVAASGSGMAPNLSYALRNVPFSVAIEKNDVNDPIPAGYTLQYTIVVTNTGESKLPAVIVTDTLPAGTLYQGAVPEGAWDSVNKTVVWDLGTIPAGDVVTIQLYVHTLTNLEPGTVLNNEAVVASYVGVSDTDTVDTTVITAPATPTPSATLTATATATPTATDIWTPTPTATATATDAGPTATSTATVTPSATTTGPTATPTATATATATGPTPTPTVTATTGAINGRVWVDQDANGEIGAGEAGLAGATVRLLDSASAVLETWVTGADGSYNFMGLAPADYTVEVELPAGYFGTTPASVTRYVAVGAIETINFGAVQYGTATPTPTATIFPDLVIEGWVTEQMWLNSVGNPVADARVSASACGSPAVETTTAEDGYYSLTIQGSDLAGCETVTITVDARGYGAWTGEYRVVDLLVDPRVDVLLTRSPGLWVWLPVVMK